MGFPSSFSFLGIGIPEVMLILILALVVLGPERLPGVAKEIVKGFFRLRNLSKELTGQLEQELGMEELKELNNLKDIKTGGLIEKWANDELDLNLDEEQEAESNPQPSQTHTDTTASTAKSSGARAPVQDQNVMATGLAVQPSPNGRNKVAVGSLIDSGVASPTRNDPASVVSDTPTKPSVGIENSIARAVTKESATETLSPGINGAYPPSPSRVPYRQGKSRASLTRAWPSPNRTALRHPLAPVRMRTGRGLHGRLLLTRWR